MRLWARCAVIALIATESLALAGCGKKEDAGRVPVDQSSAKATLETLAQAVKARDSFAMGLCVPDEFRESINRMFGAGFDAIARAESVQKTVEAKFGKDAAQKAFKASPANRLTNKGPLGDALDEDGSVNWKKVKLAESGDTASAEIEGRSDKVALKKIDDKWYWIPEGTPPEDRKKQADQIRKAADEAVKACKDFTDDLATIERQVQAGTLSKAEDVQKALEDAGKDAGKGLSH